MADQIKFFEHPDYQARKEYWQTVGDLYEGDHTTLADPKYLWRHEFETVLYSPEGSEADHYQAQGARTLRKIRETRTRYINRLRAIIRRYVAIMLINGIDLKPAEPLFEENQIDDVDGEGTSFIDFLKAAFEQYFRDGWVMGEINAYAFKAKNKLEEKQLGLRPFMSLLSALEVKDWDIEATLPKRKGKYNAFRNEYVAVLPRTSLRTEPLQYLFCREIAPAGTGFLVTRFRGPKVQTGQDALVTEKTEWQMDGEPAAIALEELPIVVLCSKRALIADVVPLCLLRHNTQSSLDNGILFQAHQRILASGTFKPGQGMVMHEGTVSLLPDGATITVVEPSNPIANKERLAQIDAEIIQLAFLKERAIPLDSRETEAADAQKEGNRDFLAEMKAAAREGSQFATEMCRKWAESKGVAWDKELKIDDDFEQEDIDRQVQILTSLWDIVRRYPTWTKAELKKIVEQRNLPDADEIIAEIEAMDTPGEAEQAEADAQRDALRAAMLGRGAPGETEEDMNGRPEAESAPEGDGRRGEGVPAEAR